MAIRLGEEFRTRSAQYLGINWNNTAVIANATGEFSGFVIYKGTPPTTIDSWMAQVGVNPTGHADALIWWEYANTSFISGSHYHYFDDEINLAPQFFTSKAAVGTGAAAYFVFYMRTSSALKGVVIGSVGAIGSGADIELTEINYVAAKQYNAPHNFTMKYPTPGQ